MPDFTLHQGTAPLLVSLPHDGTALPESIAARVTAAGKRVPDTDWHVGKLYAFARDLGASVLVPHWSRYVVDLNRDPAGHALYPGKSETTLVPVKTFAGEPIYVAGAAPDEKEITARRETWWQPYHDALAGELDRMRKQHDRVVLWDGHSIKSRVPMFFEGRLPDFNLGTAAGASCSPALQVALVAVLRHLANGGEAAARQVVSDQLADGGQDRYSHVVNGRFKGGYITRHYGQPHAGIEAVQLELAECTYMDEESFEYQPERAAPVGAILRALLETCLSHVAA